MPMISQSSLKKIAVSFFVLSILLLLLNVGISIVYPISIQENSAEISGNDLTAIFKQSLQSFAIKDEWIYSSISNEKIPFFKINVPVDLSIAQILADLNSRLSQTNLFVTSAERKTNGRTSMQILSGKKVKLQAEFIYNNQIRRTENKCVLFIYGRHKNEADYDSLIQNLPNDYSCLLVPSKSSSIYTRWLKEHGFDYAVLLNDDITELEFKIGKDYSTKRISLIIKNLVISFPNAAFFMIDKKSRIYSSAVLSILKKEFLNKKIAFFPSDSLFFLQENDKDIINSFKNAVSDLKPGKSCNIALLFSDFEKLSDEIKKIIRVGFRFVKFSQQLPS